MVSVVAALATPWAVVWVTIGPGTARRDWVATAEWLAAAWPSFATLATAVPVLGVGLLLRPGGRAARGWRVAWFVWAHIHCYAVFFAAMFGALRMESVAESGAPSADWGVGVEGPLGMAALLPIAVVFRVWCARTAAADRAAAEASRARLASDRRPAPTVTDSDPAVRD
jgi:hypothetical protein